MVTYNNLITCCRLSPGGITSYQAVNRNKVNGHVQNNMLLNYAKNMQINAGIFKKLAFKCSEWPRLILSLRNRFAKFIAKWCHLFYKFVKHTFNLTEMCSKQHNV